MSASNGVKIIFGSAAWLTTPVAEVEQWLDTIQELGIKHIDTAAIYGESENLLGQTKAATTRGFIVDTKHASGFDPNPTNKESVIEGALTSLARLQTESVSSILPPFPLCLNSSSQVC